MNEQAFIAETQPWTWRERWRSRLFPSQPCPLPAAPATFEDCVVVTTRVRFGLLDRLRVLLTGCVVVQTKTVAEHIVGETVTASVAYPVVSLPGLKK